MAVVEFSEWDLENSKLPIETFTERFVNATDGKLYEHGVGEDVSVWSSVTTDENGKPHPHLHLASDDMSFLLDVDLRDRFKQAKKDLKKDGETNVPIDDIVESIAGYAHRGQAVGANDLPPMIPILRSREWVEEQDDPFNPPPVVEEIDEALPFVKAYMTIDDMAIVRASDLSDWGATPAELDRKAQSTVEASEAYRPHPVPITSVLEQMGVPPVLHPSVPVPICCTNNEQFECAAAVLNEAVMSELYETIGEDFTVSFTSVHEFLASGVSVADYETLKLVLDETIQEATDLADVLTDEVFVYDGQSRKLTAYADYAATHGLPVPDSVVERDDGTDEPMEKDEEEGDLPF